MAGRKPTEVGIDMTPMIDVVFQLIIFFMVTVNAEQESYLKDLVLQRSPNAEERKRGEPREITIQVDKQGRYYVGSLRFQLSQIDNFLRNAARQVGASNIPILIRGDRESQHKAIRQVMDVCSKNGIYKIRFAGMKRDSRQPR
jgi:biopolymer transport protein ExbD